MKMSQVLFDYYYYFFANDPLIFTCLVLGSNLGNGNLQLLQEANCHVTQKETGNLRETYCKFING